MRMLPVCIALAAPPLLLACGELEPSTPPPVAGDLGASADDGRSSTSGGRSWRDVAPQPAGSCEFTHDEDFASPGRGGPEAAGGEDLEEEAPWDDEDGLASSAGEIDRVAHDEPPPTSLLRLRPKDDGDDELTLPRWDDTLPLFERAGPWEGVVQRCYETPLGALWLTEGQAYELYVEMAEATTGATVDATPGVRTVVGVRGAYPGSLLWHGNAPNRYNDTLALLWIDETGAPRVREFPATTDPGAHNFGTHRSSILRPNRRYRYADGTHGGTRSTYDALAMQEEGYEVRDDTNHNGHWDSDRNGWLPPTGRRDHFRSGSDHNIHGAGVPADVSLGAAPVNGASAGCQAIPGTRNYQSFITTAWTARGDEVWYFLLDARDVAPEVWHPCAPDGTPDCPLPLTSFPATLDGDTARATSSAFDRYPCATSNESGPEVVHVLTLDQPATLTARVACATGIDVDVHILEADDARACLARGDAEVARVMAPGRYFVVVDSYVPSSGIPLAGPYTLSLTLE